MHYGKLALALSTLDDTDSFRQLIDVADPPGSVVRKQLVKRRPARLLRAAVSLADLQAAWSIMDDAPIIANKMRLPTIAAHAQNDGAAIVL